MKFDLTRRLAAEALGTFFLVMAVVGSGIMAEKLAGGNEAIALLCNTLATGAVLVRHHHHFRFRLRRAFQPGGDLGDAAARQHRTRRGARLCGGADRGRVPRRGGGASDVRPRPRSARLDRADRVRPMARRVHRHVRPDRDHPRLRAVQARTRWPAAVGLYITSAYWFTSSTSFANPAVTIARALSDTFAGIAPGDAPGFVVAELLGAVAAAYLFGWLFVDEAARPDRAD